MLSLLLVLLCLSHTLAQLQTCTGPVLRFPPQSKGRCVSWTGQQRGETMAYPDDFEGILNQVAIYRCPARGKRVIISNGIPNHEVTLQNRSGPCEFRYVVEIPLEPSVANVRTEVPIRGMIAMAMNGVPAYGPQEADYNNAVEGTMGVPGARFWYGHAGPNSAWHVHNPKMGKEVESHETLMGYAMDGFPIFGHLEDDSELDACNGMYGEDGSYRYHVRTLEQVDESLEYCNGNSPETNWNYILGCYSGSVDETEIHDSTTYSLDDDCVIDEGPEHVDGLPLTGVATTTLVGDTATSLATVPIETTTTATKDTPARPNIIIMQPDDMLFYDEWNRPPNLPNDPTESIPLPSNGLPNLETLRLNGVQMMQAYTTSPMCGTSRFSTITARHPSRALSNESGGSPSRVVIPTTKLEGDDCTKDNLAVQFRDGGGYRTAMIGKWHLSHIDKDNYTYEGASNTVRGCGFDTVEGLHVENFNAYSDGSFSHNMEWITSEAIKIIEEDSEEPFFMYFNPTVPHRSNDITSALTDFSCRDTAAGRLDADPTIPGMTDDGDCESYRQTIFDRAENEDDLGAIWLDDSVGALLKTLERTGKLDDTIFLFQQDHGINPKGSLYEGGIRIPQFVHYPAAISAGAKLDVPVSVIDVGATMLDYAGITPSYDIDGTSWKVAVANGDSTAAWEDRCLYFELERDRAVRCGCFKYLSIDLDDSTTFIRGRRNGLSNDDENLFDLCNGSNSYVAEIEAGNMEVANLIDEDPTLASDLATLLDCHLERIENGVVSECQLSPSGLDVSDVSIEPSTSPTEKPTQSPTEQPSSIPTGSLPSLSPLNAPTSHPSSRIRSSTPTLDALNGGLSNAVPTMKPSMEHIIQSTTQPSLEPTAPFYSSSPTTKTLTISPNTSSQDAPPTITPSSPRPSTKSTSQPTNLTSGASNQHTEAPTEETAIASRASVISLGATSCAIVAMLPYLLT